MARQQRFHQSLTLYHVMLRGNDGQPIFFEEEDKERLSYLIGEGVGRFGHLIHAFCFMNNHIHLAVQVQEVPLSHIMQNIAFRYCQYINKKYERIGHLFQGRYKAIIIDGEGYFKELVRYIHLNPVRAQLVDRPEQYRWSGHNAYIQQDQYSWLTTQVVLKRFGDTISEAIDRYLNFIQLGIGVESKIDFKSGLTKGIVGNEEFADQFYEKAPISPKLEIDLPELVLLISNYCSIPIEVLRGNSRKHKENQARALMALLVRESKNLTFAALGACLNRTPSGLSKIAIQLEKNGLQSPELQKQVEDLKRLIRTKSPKSSTAHV